MKIFSILKVIIFSFLQFPLVVLGFPSSSTMAHGDQKVQFILLQVNDVYELLPVKGEGGLARLATLKKQLIAENPNTYMVLSGDVLSPSALGTAQIDGGRLHGKQMIDSFNHVGLDFATLGNHEFDLKLEEVQQRLTESKTTWVISNATDAQGHLFLHTRKNDMLKIIDTDQEFIHVGFFGVMLNSNTKDYVRYTDVLTTARQQVSELSSQVEMIIAITHLRVEQDQQLAKQEPQISLILGGHEHNHMAIEVGPRLPKIYKADANARSAYIHRITYHLDTHKSEIQSELKRLTADIPEDQEVAKVVNHWVKLAYEGFRKEKFEPDSVVAHIPIPLDGLERSVRFHSTELTKLIAETMRLAMNRTELSFFNGGFIRIDDVLPPGPLTHYDIIRTLPFREIIVSIEMKGSLLKKVLDTGQQEIGHGGDLHTAGGSFRENNWLINDQPLDLNRIYRVATNGFLLTGKETGLEFFNRHHPELKVIETGPDLRQALIAEIQRRYK